MSLADHLQRLKDLLSEDDLQQFQTLSRKLTAMGGDLSQLTDDDRELILKMEEKYGDAIRETAVEHADEVPENLHESNETVSDANSSQTTVTSGQVVPDQFPLLKTEFADYVKDMLLRELGEQHSDLKSAVQFAYENKWLPSELKNPDVCETLFERFYSDIEQANQWRAELDQSQLKPDADTGSKLMAVGLCWFMYVFQLKQWLEKQ